MSSSGWTLRNSAIDFTGLYHWWKIAGASESATVTITPGGTVTAELFIEEYSGNTATPTDVTANNDPAVNASSIASGTTAALAQADELAVVAFGWNDSTGTAGLATSLSGGYAINANLRGLDPTTMDTWLAVGSLATSATTAQSSTATLAASAGRPVGLIATYKAAVVAVTLPPLVMAPLRR